MNITSLLPSDKLAPAGRWTGFQPFNCVGGHNDATFVPSQAFQSSVSRALKTDGHRLAAYNLGDGPLGHLGLRQFIAGMLYRRAGMSCSEDDVLIVSGSLQALDLVNQTMLRPGDTVLIEASTYAGVMSRLDRMGVHYHGVPLDDDGMDITALASLLEDLASQNIRPRYLYTIPSVQNPTGSVMPQERRKQILKLTQRYNVPLFEDDCYSDLVWEGDRPATFYGLADGKGVIYCGSFSKSLAPALRVGYLVAPWEVLSHILPYKTDAGSGALEQMVLADFCPEHYENHVTALTQHLAQKCDIMCAALDRYFGASADYQRPKGGIFVWVTLPSHVDSVKLAKLAGADGISINPGPDWSIAPEAPHQFRLCFGYPDAAIIEEGVLRLANICQQEFGVPLAIDNI